MSEVSPGEGNPADLLLVEDNPGDARLFEEMFEDASLLNMLHLVSDGDEALDFMHQRGEYVTAPFPDLIFLDWNLPTVSGEEVLTELKNDEKFHDIPVIVLIGSEAEEKIIRPEANQADSIITKPVEPDDLFDVFRQFEEFWLSVVRVSSEDLDT